MTVPLGSNSGTGPKVVVAAGGTGGHVYPALSVADDLRARGYRVLWLGTREGIEAELVPEAGYEIHYLPVAGLRGKGLVKRLSGVLRLIAALIHAVGLICRWRPHLVLGMGGFASGPAGVAAWLMRRPLVIHEQNAIPGLTNRILSRLATRVLEAFPGSFPPSRGAECTGNPVRREITDLSPPAERMAGRSGPLRLLVLGGSQGAKAINEVVPAALRSLDDAQLVIVRHQAGPRHLESARRGYHQVQGQVEVSGYIKDMAEAYGWADVVLCRAGAMTIAELSASGAVSILVPFPYAVDDHQTSNARHLVDGDAGILLPQNELSGTRLGDLLRELAGARERLQAMAEAARRLAVPDSADRVGRLCAEVARA